MGLKKYRQFVSINERWNGEDDAESDPKVPHDIPFKCLEEDGSEIAIFQNIHTKKYYCFPFADMDEHDFYEYASLPMYRVDDEYGKTWEIDYEYFEFNEDVLENYVNDNLNLLNYGEGLEDYEAGEANFILIDETLKEVLKRDFKLKSI